MERRMRIPRMANLVSLVGLLEIDGDEIECPLHQARFHLPTGEVRAAPATENIRTYPVKVTGDEIYIRISGS